MTPEYRRGYGNGYNAGCRRSDEELRNVRVESIHVAERAERAEKAQGLGQCEECTHWARGCDNCAWGYCHAPLKLGAPRGAWFADADGVRGRKIQTSARFGCVLFAAAKEGKP